MSLEIKQVLLRTRIFSGFTAEDIDELLPVLQVSLKQYRKNEIIIHEGMPVERLAIVAQGEFQEFKSSITKKECVMRILREGDTLGIPEYL